MPIVSPSQLGSVGAPSAPSAGPAQPGWESPGEAGAAMPTWGRLGISPEEVAEQEEPEPQHGYTWLHMIVLSLVAFVAGLLVWLLLIQGRGVGGVEGLAESPAGSVGAVSAVVPSPPGEL